MLSIFDHQHYEVNIELFKGKFLVSESLWFIAELCPEYDCTFVPYFPYQLKSLQVCRTS